jgi:hypothetical protein
MAQKRRGPGHSKSKATSARVPKQQPLQTADPLRALCALNIQARIYERLFELALQTEKIKKGDQRELVGYVHDCIIPEIQPFVDRFSEVEPIEKWLSRLVVFAAEEFLKLYGLSTVEELEEKRRILVRYRANQRRPGRPPQNDPEEVYATFRELLSQLEAVEYRRQLRLDYTLEELKAGLPTEDVADIGEPLAKLFGADPAEAKEMASKQPEFITKILSMTNRQVAIYLTGVSHGLKRSRIEKIIRLHESPDKPAPTPKSKM